MKLTPRLLSRMGIAASELVGGNRLMRNIMTVEAPAAAVSSSPIDTAKALLECARPHQWAKNTLVFAPLVLAGALSEPGAVLATVLSFIALCLVASSTYLINDVVDVADDRKHWSKRNRPIARGALSVTTALTAALIGLLAGFVFALAAAPLAVLALGAYLVLTLAYSGGVKRVPVLDVFTLATLFTLRLVLGIAAAGVVASPWLLTFSMFLFASLCFAKRYVEVEGAAARGWATLKHRGYQGEDTPLIMALGVASSIASIVIMVLFIIFDAYERSFYGNTMWLWAFPMVLFLWTSRVWLLAIRRQLDDDPVAFAVSDPPSLVLGAVMLVAFLLAWSGSLA